jgi:transposase-like protein
MDKLSWIEISRRSTSKAFQSAFKWRHFLPEIIIWGVRWYCLFPISYRQLEQMMCD